MRQRLCYKYEKEREDILQKVLTIIDLDDDKCFYLIDMDEAYDKQTELESLQEDLKKYYTITEIQSLVNPMAVKRLYLSIIRNVLKRHNYVVISNVCTVYRRDLPVRTTRYYVVSPDNTKKCEKSKVRNIRSELYKEEREELCKRMLNMLDLDEHNTFYLWDIENDEKKQEDILSLKPEIQKYYSSGEIWFRKDREPIRKSLFIIRSLLRRHNYRLYSSSKKITRNGEPVRSLQFVVFKDCCL